MSGAEVGRGVVTAATAHTPQETWFAIETSPPGGGVAIGPVHPDYPYGHTVVQYNGGDSEDRAALIVTAVNERAGLVAERDSLREALWAAMPALVHCHEIARDSGDATEEAEAFAVLAAARKVLG